MVEELWAGRYRRDRVLGRGAMGEVWAAHDNVLDRPVAIKSIAHGRTDREDLDRMAREARVAARIGHPNAVGVYDLLTVDGRPNLVMEYVEGVTLDELVTTRGRVEPHEAARIGAAIADALAEAHRLGVVHRDIKPANILITRRGEPKLADFGIARAAGDVHLTAKNATIGTPAYLAPEIVQGRAADARSDVWSLGVTLYAALQGSPPFVVSPDDELMVVLSRVLSMPIHPPAVGGALGATVMAMLERDPTRRPSAATVAARLRDPRAPDSAGTSPSASDSTVRLASAEAPTSRIGAGPPGPARRRRSLVLVPVAVLVIAVATVLTVVLTRGPGTPRAPSTQRYRAPSDIVTLGPPGWHRDASDRSVFVADYLSPHTHDRHLGDYFRLGVHARHAKPDIGTTAADERASLLDRSQSGLSHPVIESQHYVHYQGTRAVDVEWTGVNPEHVARHALVRLWSNDGVTRELTVNTTAANWPGARALFDQLAANLTIDR